MSTPGNAYQPHVPNPNPSPIVVGPSKGQSSAKSQPGLKVTADAKPSLEACFAKDVIGYLFLSLKGQKESAETRSFTSSTDHYKSLRDVIHELDRLHVKPNQPVEGAALKQLLALAKVPPERWNAVVKRVASLPNGRQVLDQAVIHGEAVALNLAEDASKQLRTVEKRLQKDDFEYTELSRLVEHAAHARHRTASGGGKSKVVLYSIRMKPIYDIPIDGFDKYTFSPTWFIGTALVKLQGLLTSMTNSKADAEHEPAVQAAKSRSWLAPVGSSVKSPSIQSFLKKVAASSIETEVIPIPDNRGCLLEFRFSVKPHLLSLVVDKLRRNA